jgi:hypothetical protein
MRQITKKALLTLVIPTRNEAENVSPKAVQRRRLINMVSLLVSFLLLLAFAIAWQTNLSIPYAIDADEGIFLLSADMIISGYPQFTSLFNPYPPLFLEILALAFRAFGDTVVVGREVMVFFSLVSLSAIAWIGWRLAGPFASPMAMLFLGLSYTFFRQGHIVQSDMPALAFTLLAVAIVLPVAGSLSSKRIIAGGVLFAFAMLCKLLVAPMILPILFLLTLAPISNETKKWHFLPAKRSSASILVRRLFIFSVASVTTCLLAFLGYDLSAAYDQAIAFHLEKKDYYSGHMFDNLLLLLAQPVREPGVMLLAAAGLVILLLRNPIAAVWICLWALATGLFLLNHSPLFMHHLVLFFPPFAVAAAASVLWATTLYRRPWAKLLAPVLLLSLPLIGLNSDEDLQWSVQRDLAALSHTPSQEDQEQEALHLIRSYTEPEDLVVSDQQIQLFITERQPPPSLNETSYARIESDSLNDEQAISASADARMIIFWAGRLELLPQYRQWVQSNFQLLQQLEGKNGQTKEVYFRESTDKPVSTDEARR